MEIKPIFWKVTSAVLLLIILVLTISVIMLNIEKKREIEKRDNYIESIESKIKETNKNYEELYDQKNGTANEQLVNATNGVFSSIFDYDTKKDTIKDRREKASEFTTEQALESIFPKQATSYNASVQTVSKIKDEPQIFYSPTNNDVQKVLIIIDNEITIEGSAPQEAKFMYLAEFDPVNNQFVSLENAGTLND